MRETLRTDKRLNALDLSVRTDLETVVTYMTQSRSMRLEEMMLQNVATRVHNFRQGNPGGLQSLMHQLETVKLVKTEINFLSYQAFSTAQNCLRLVAARISGRVFLKTLKKRDNFDFSGVWASPSTESMNHCLPSKFRPDTRWCEQCCCVRSILWRKNKRSPMRTNFPSRTAPRFFENIYMFAFFLWFFNFWLAAVPESALWPAVNI